MTAHNRGVKPSLHPDADALTKAPPVPKWLAPHAKAEWKRIMPQLIARRILTKGDLGGVETYCQMVGTIRQITEERAASGAIDPKMEGLAVRCATTARQLAAEYGLSPTSRARIGAVQADDDPGDNPLEV